MSTFAIKADTHALDALTADLTKVDAKALGEAMVETVNDVAASSYALARKTITSGINLNDDYIQRRMELKKASGNKPVADITAFGASSMMTNISHYGAMQLSATVRWSNAWIQANVGYFGPWPHWTKRKGNPRIGIPVDYKQAGMSAAVTTRKPIGKKFSIPNVKDTEGNPLVFRNLGPGGKDGKGHIEPVLGPSVYQLFRATIPKIDSAIEEDLAKAVLDTAEAEFKKVLQ